MTPTAVLVDLNDRQAWLAARRTGIGSSDAAALLGMDKYASPMSVYVSKVEEIDEGDNEAMRWGRLLEDAVAQGFAEDNPDWYVTRAPCMYRSASETWMLANPDRLLHAVGLVDDDEEYEPVIGDYADAASAILEIKTNTTRADEYEDGPPDRVLIQVQHQLAVMDMFEAWVAVLRNGREYRQFHVARDEKVIDLLREVETDFWNRVETRNPPPADGTEATADALKALYATPVEDEVDISHLSLAIRNLAAVKREIKTLEESQTSIENTIKATLGNATDGFVDGELAITWRAAKEFQTGVFIAEHHALARKYAKGIDLKMLQRDQPDLYEAYRKPGSRRLIPRESK